MLFGIIVGSIIVVGALIFALIALLQFGKKKKDTNADETKETAESGNDASKTVCEAEVNGKAGSKKDKKAGAESKGAETKEDDASKENGEGTKDSKDSKDNKDAKACACCQGENKDATAEDKATANETADACACNVDVEGAENAEDAQNAVNAENAQNANGEDLSDKKTQVLVEENVRLVEGDMLIKRVNLDDVIIIPRDDEAFENSGKPEAFDMNENASKEQPVIIEKD